jgi:hypothetical protein
MSMLKFNFSLRRGPAIIRPRDSWMMKMRDAATAIQFRMPAGYSGALNRAHPASVIAHQNDPTNPVAFFGEGVMVNAGKNAVRGMLASDGTTGPIFGIAVRPFPFQQSQASADFAPAVIGTSAPLAGMAIDVLKSGFVMVSIPAGQTPGLGDPVYIWTAVASGAHVQGGLEAVNPSGNGFQVDTAVTTYFNGGPDANGNVEVAFRQ